MNGWDRFCSPLSCFRFRVRIFMFNQISGYLKSIKFMRFLVFWWSDCLHLLGKMIFRLLRNYCPDHRILAVFWNLRYFRFVLELPFTLLERWRREESGFQRKGCERSSSSANHFLFYFRYEFWQFSHRHS